MSILRIINFFSTNRISDHRCGFPFFLVNIFKLSNSRRKAEADSKGKSEPFHEDRFKVLPKLPVHVCVYVRAFDEATKNPAGEAIGSVYDPPVDLPKNPARLIFVI
ncbi:Uncharacterised protein at_DN0918, partial [Pycnogonum litorale]